MPLHGGIDALRGVLQALPEAHRASWQRRWRGGVAVRLRSRRRRRHELPLAHRLHAVLLLVLDCARERILGPSATGAARQPFRGDISTGIPHRHAGAALISEL
eukprot:2770385-Pyramimonas_sp.AAC.1